MQKEKFSEWPLTDAFGICRQTVLPLYRKPTFDSALVTQLLFGECYQVHSVTPDKLWYKIFHEDSTRTGWISTDSLKSIPIDEYSTFLSSDYQVVTSPIAAIEYMGANLYLLPGSRLHFSDLELFNWQDHLGFTGLVRPHAKKARRDELVEIGLKFVNSPFQSGGRSIFGMDEQHFIELVFGIGGYSWKAKRVTGRKVDIELAMPGDLLTFKSSDKSPNHFALYLGAEEVLWMDNRARISDINEWETCLLTTKDTDLTLEVRSILN
jgi:uncharacterized protein YgiM (DUF1202 family)